MSRHLAITERRVSATARPEYLESLRTRQQAAAQDASHFWVFAHASDGERYVEFVEGGDASRVAALAGVAQENVWRALEVK